MISFHHETDLPAEPRTGWLSKAVRGLLSPSGTLAQSPDYEPRPEQESMAIAVAKALEKSHPLIVEAGTGVGKSLAYLIPSLLHVHETGGKALLSTHTINLQEQLLQKDIPLALKATKLDLPAVLYKGRGNFLCPRRLSHALQQAPELFNTSDQAELQQLLNWSRLTTDGSLSTLPFTPTPRVWAQVRSELHLCTPRTCGPHSGCFYQELRRKVAEAKIVVMNHTLFFTLWAAQDELPQADRNFLFPNDFIVMDEAHTLEETAAKQLGLNLSQADLSFDLQRLHHPKLKRGYFHLLRDLDGAREVDMLHHQVDAFFEDLMNEAVFRPPSREYRVREPGLVDHTLQSSLLSLTQRLQNHAEKARDETFKSELEDAARRVNASRLAIQHFLDHEEPNSVYWIEQRGTGEREHLALRSAPVDVSRLLERIFFSKGKTSIHTSATLAVAGKSLSWFQKRVGGYKADTLQIGSPFDYQKQMRLYLSRRIPDPDHHTYLDVLEQHVRYLLELTDGHAFVLFTSYRLLGQMADRLNSICRQRGWKLLAQGRGLARHQMLSEFKEARSSVLLGTDSFWTGVDVPGEKLSNVIITRLPFAVPDHPLTAARMEHIELNGGKPFFDYSVPEAVLKLRQGVGRLIRSKKDHGIVAILDPRVLTKSYGKTFLQAMPVCPIDYLD